MMKMLSNECTVKKPTFLDLSNGRRTGRRPLPCQLLESPDIKRIGLTSPELENFIKQMSSTTLPKLNNILPFSGLTPCDTPSQEVMKYQIRDDQQQANFETSKQSRLHLELAKDSLDNQRNTNDQATAKISASLAHTNSSTIASNDTNPSAITTQVKAITSSLPIVKIKNESKSSIASLPPVAISSVTTSSGRTSRTSDRKDGKDDEVNKLEKKRERNRQAAAKCRHKKILRIQELETLKNQLTEEKLELTKKIKDEEDQIAKLRECLMLHLKTECKKVAH